MKKWLQDDPWLSEIYENGAKEHFENLEISVGWRDLKFNLNSFEGVHETYTASSSALVSIWLTLEFADAIVQ